MYKYSVMLCGVFSSLSASYASYGLEPSKDVLYFVKIGAYQKNVYAMQEKNVCRMPTHIVHLQDYYSVLSEGYKSKRDANRALRLFKKCSKDAYVISLYKKTDRPIKMIKTPVLQRSHVIMTTAEDSAYTMGIKLYQVKQYEEALSMFDRALIEDEDDIDAGMFYAKTLYVLKMSQDAKKSFEALLDKALTQAQKKQVMLYLEQIEAKRKRHYIQWIFSGGVGYDDNINLTTDASITHYGSMTLLNDTNKTTSTSAIGTLSLQHRYKATSFELVSTLYTYNEFMHTAKGNDLTYVDVSTGLGKGIGAWGFWLPIGANISLLNGKKIGHNFYTAPALTYRINEHVQGSLSGQYVDNTSTYMREKDFISREALVGLAYQQKDFFVSVKVGSGDVSLKKDFRYDMDKKGLSSQFFARFNVDKNIYVSGMGSYTKGTFTYVDPVMGYARKDTQQRVGLSLGYKLTDAGVVELNAVQTHNDSNVNAYAYDRINYTLQYYYTIKD